MPVLKLYVDKVRIEKGVSIRELAARAGISKSHVQRIEAGESVPSLEVICRIAKALNVPVTDLFSFEG